MRFVGEGPHYLVKFCASGAILDPDLTLMPLHPFKSEEPNVVSIETRLDLFNGQLILYFSGRNFIPFFWIPDEQFPFDELRYFIMYRSRVNYNVVWPESVQGIPNLESSSEVTFLLQRMVEVERDETIGGKRCRVWYHQPEPYHVTIPRPELEDLLTLGTRELCAAVACYLIGCENPRYFLVEFYKAIECIENALGGEQRAISALKPYGVTKDIFKKVKVYADHERHPFDIGRHAPRKGANVRVIDVRRLLEEPLSHQIFSESLSAVRQVIDAYFSLLRSSRKQVAR